MLLLIGILIGIPIGFVICAILSAGRINEDVPQSYGKEPIEDSDARE